MSGGTQVFRLLHLPAELRNRIYHLHLIKGRVIRPQFKEDLKEKNEALVLSRCCEQIHEETRSIYYGSNHFRFYDFTLHEDYFTWYGDDITLDEDEQSIHKLEQWLNKLSLDSMCQIEHLSTQGAVRNQENCPKNRCYIRIDLDLKHRTAASGFRTICCGEAAEGFDYGHDYSEEELDHWQPQSLNDFIEDLNQLILPLRPDKVKPHCRLPFTRALASALYVHFPITHGAFQTFSKKDLWVFK